MPFQPDALKVDARGYLYHPSPEAQQNSSRRRRQPQGDKQRGISEPYGKYSLLRSELVISHFGKSLELQDNGSGSYEWLGHRQCIELLKDGEATLGLGWRDL